MYYGLYVSEEHVGGGLLKRVFPGASEGDLFEGGWTPKTNELMPNKDRLKMFWAAGDIGAVAAVVDLEESVMEWAAEAMLNDGDGYYGGGHNFYIYDYPGKGYRWLIDDADATFAWLGRSDDSPIYWWARRTSMQDAGQHYLIVIADPTWRGRYIEALRTQLGRWDVAKLQGWIRRMVGADCRRGRTGSPPAASNARVRRGGGGHAAGGRRSPRLRREVPRLSGRQRGRDRR